MPAAASLNDFEVLYTIGSGSYGTCKKVKRKHDGKIFVWKEMDYGSMTESEKQMLVSEVNLLRELKHDNIVRYHERIIDKSRQVLYLIMEYCEGGDLAALIKRYQRDGRYFDEEMVWKTLAQCASALSDCHKRKDGKCILHRDLKPANIFLDANRNVKLGDFGLARVLHHETSFALTFVGTPYYMSPEQMSKSSYNEKSDIWSLGCVLYEMCTHRPPFLASNQKELAAKIRTGHFNRIPSRYSSDLAQLLSRMLNVECNARPSIEELLNTKQVIKHVKITPIESEANAHSKDELYKKCLERETMLAQREARIDLAETKLKEREAELHQKEMRLDQLDLELKQKALQLAEKEVQLSKYAISNENNKHGRHVTGLQERNINQCLRDADDKECMTKPITPILARARKAPDSPTKHVSFKVEKENDIRSLAANMAALLKDDTDPEAEAQKRKELRARLERAKQRAAELRNAEFESRINSQKLLNIR